MGISTRFPREVIKQAFATELIEDGHLWIDMLDKRNELSYTYSDEQAKKAVDIIKNKYFQAIEQVYLILKKEM